MRRQIWLTALAICMGLPSLAHGQWYGAADFILPSRSVPSNRVYQRNIAITTTTSGTPPVTTTTELVGADPLLTVDLGSVAGGRATVGYRPGFVGIEGSWMITDQWTSSASLFDPNGLLASPFTPIGTAPNPTFDENTFASVTYDTQLKSGELNLTCLIFGDGIGEATCRFGVRAMSLEENFSYLTENATTQNSWSLATKNQLIGPQFGIRGYTNVPGGMLGLNCLGGLAYNQIDRTEIFNAFSSTRDTTEASAFGEIGVEYVFLPTPNLAIRLGYQFMGLTNVGLALDNPRLSSDQTDDVLYQIPYIGIAASY